MDTTLPFISQTKTNMSYGEAVIAGTGNILEATFTTNIIPKAVTSFFTVIYGMIITGNETIVGMIFMLFVIDLITGVASALKNRAWESRKFFMGCTKFLVYGIFAAIAVSLGEVLGVGNFFLSGIFAFLIITDSGSILENLDKLGYNTPIFLKKYLKVAQKNIEDKYINPTIK